MTFHNPITKKQLSMIERADLSNFNEATGTFLIKRRFDIKLEVNGTYLIFIKPTFFTNETIHINWNRNSAYPTSSYMQIQVNQIAAKMARITGICYDIVNNSPTGSLWSGWIPISDIEIKEKL